MLTYNPIALAPFLAGLISVLFTIYSYWIRPEIGRWRTTLLFFSIACYCFGTAGLICSSNMADAILLLKIKFIGTTLATPLWLSIIIRYSGFDYPAVRKIIPIIFLFPIFALIIALSPYMIPWFIQSVTMNPAGPTQITYQFGPFNLISVANNLICLLISTGLLILSFSRAGHLFKKQILLLILGTLSPFLALILDFILLQFPSMGPISGLDLVPFGLLIAELTLIPAISRYHFMDILPIAQSTVMENIPIGVLVLDVKERIREINPAGMELFCVSGPDPLGKKASDIIVGWEKLRENLTDSDHPFEYRVQNEGRMESYMVNYIPLKDVNGIRTGSIILLFSITERIEKENRIIEYAGIIETRNNELLEMHQKLEEINHDLDNQVQDRTREVQVLLTQKDYFIEQLAHDLRSPLIPLVGLIPFLIEMEKDPQITRILGQMKNSIDVMRNTVEQVLELAQLNNQYLITDRTSYDVVVLIAEVYASLKPLAEEHGVSFRFDIPSDSMVLLSPVHAPVIFRHILSNAIRYNIPGGSVEVRGVRKDDWILISVQDTGKGIDHEELPRIFDEFYRVDHSRKNLEAKGLGLTIVKRMVTLNGGRIWAESKGLGLGSTFHICFPAIHDCQSD